MKDIKAVVFDCDGTLVDSEHAHYSAWHRAMQIYGYNLSFGEYEFCVGRPEAGCAEFFAEKVQGDPVKMLSEKREHFHQIQLLGLPGIEPTVDFVRRLYERKDALGIKMGVASAAKKEEILRNLQQHGIERCFDLVLSGENDLKDYQDSEGVNKPKPYIYLHAAKLLGFLPEECVAIEDTHIGVTAAVRAGFFTIAVPNPFTLKHNLSHASLKLDSFRGIEVDQFFSLIVERPSPKCEIQ